MLSKSYGLGDITRQQYLETYVFPNFINDSYLREHGNLTELQIENKNKVFDILRKWSRGEIEFTKQFMTRYSPRSRGGKFPFKNIGKDNPIGKYIPTATANTGNLNVDFLLLCIISNEIISTPINMPV